MTEDKIWSAALYTRISRDDGDKNESDSIASQKRLLLNYLRENQQFRMSDIYVDDGYSGIDFERPAFKHMMEDIQKGRADCVIV